MRIQRGDEEAAGMTSAPSSTSRFLDRFRTRVTSLPQLSGRVIIDESPRPEGPNVLINIGKAEASGFDIEIAFFDNWEIFVYPDKTTVSFFLTAKRKDADWNCEQIEECITFVLGLLSSGHRLRLSYSGDRLCSGIVEERVATGWKVRAKYGRLVLWNPFRARSEKVFQNHVLEGPNQGTA